ncbi:MAG: DUF6510 family protein, partial [Solirubrobacteraceae bacterium]
MPRSAGTSRPFATPAPNPGRRLEDGEASPYLTDELGPSDERWQDGDALGGLLQELLSAEMTGAPHTCQSCGKERPVAAHRAYLGAGMVLRCPVCDQIALVAAALPDRLVVHLTGAWRLEMPRAWLDPTKENDNGVTCNRESFAGAGRAARTGGDPSRA